MILSNVGGAFKQIGDGFGYGVAALDARTGQTTAWHTILMGTAVILAPSRHRLVPPRQHTLCEWGNFNRVLMAPRNGLAALEAPTGLLTGGILSRGECFPPKFFLIGAA